MASTSDFSENNEQLSACIKFCSTTGLKDGDLGLAQFYLEDSGWNVNGAIQKYRQAQLDAQELEDPAAKRLKTSHDSTGRPAGAPSSGDKKPTSKTATASKSSASGAPPSQKNFRLITWNIDGLDSQQHTLQERTKAVCDAVKLYAPDVVYLQEVIPLSCGLISSSLQDYKLIPAGQQEYFTAVLLKKSTVQHLSDNIERFPGSVMQRNLHTVQVTCAGVDVMLMCSHLESTKDFVTERVKQLKTVLECMKTATASNTVIFGGDLNLRDPEVAKAGGLPSGVSDIWQLCGQPADAKFTWDTSQNDNLGVPFKVKCRFDRLYLRQGTGTGFKVVPERFSLIGKKRLPGCKRFPSDHWGIVCDFKVEEEKK